MSCFVGDSSNFFGYILLCRKGAFGREVCTTFSINFWKLFVSAVQKSLSVNNNVFEMLFYEFLILEVQNSARNRLSRRCRYYCKYTPKDRCLSVKWPSSLSTLAPAYEQSKKPVQWCKFLRWFFDRLLLSFVQKSEF